MDLDEKFESCIKELNPIIRRWCSEGLDDYAEFIITSNNELYLAILDQHGEIQVIDLNRDLTKREVKTTIHFLKNLITMLGGDKE